MLKELLCKFRFRPIERTFNALVKFCLETSITYIPAEIAQQHITCSTPCGRLHGLIKICSQGQKAIPQNSEIP